MHFFNYKLPIVRVGCLLGWVFFIIPLIWVSVAGSTTLRPELIDVLNELANTVKVIRCEFFNVVVASSVNIVRWIFKLALIIKLLSVVERNNLISSAMNDVDRALDSTDAVDVRESIERESEPHVEHYSEGWHDWRMQHDTRYVVLLTKIARWSWANRAPVQYDLWLGYVQVFCHVQEDRLDIIVQGLFRGDLAVWFSESCVLIDDSVDMHIFQKVAFKPCLN